ncbi:MAG: hypothetical protein ACPGU1_18430 [Myxococcota bacterium]
MTGVSPAPSAFRSRRRRHRRALVLGVLMGSLLACEAWAGSWSNITLTTQSATQSR